MSELCHTATPRPGRHSQRGRMGDVGDTPAARVPVLPPVPGAEHCALLFLAIALPPVQRGRDRHEETFFDFFTDTEREQAAQNVIDLLGEDGVREVIGRRLHSDD